MRGYKLRLLFEIILSFALGVFLTFWGNGWSWSENAMEETEALKNANEMHPLLNGLLITTSWAFRSLAENFEGGKDIQFTVWKGFYIRTKHLLFSVSYSFGAILIFQMDSDITPDMLHYVATGWAVVSLVLFVSAYFKMWSEPWHIFTWSILGAGLWLAVSFIWGFSLVRYPEFALMVVALILLTYIIYFKNKSK